jgi:hypothetical protein
LLSRLLGREVASGRKKKVGRAQRVVGKRKKGVEEFEREERISGRGLQCKDLRAGPRAG